MLVSRIRKSCRWLKAIKVAHGSRLQPHNPSKQEARATLGLKFENDFATAFSLGSVCDCRLRFAQGVSFLNFRF